MAIAHCSTIRVAPAALIALTLLWWLSPLASAQSFDDIKMVASPPDGQIIYGNAVQWSLENKTSWTIVNQRYEFRDPVNGNWVPLSWDHEPPVITYETRPGTFKNRVRFWVYEEGEPAAYGPYYAYYDYTVPPPDEIVFVEGWEDQGKVSRRDQTVPWGNDERVRHVYQLKCKGKECRYSQGFVQEWAIMRYTQVRYFEAWYWEPKDPARWRPNYDMIDLGGKLTDGKGVTSSAYLFPIWGRSRIAVGQQRFRMMIPDITDPEQKMKPYPLKGFFTTQWYKTDEPGAYGGGQVRCIHD
jgi:hypothetical protein